MTDSQENKGNLQGASESATDGWTRVIGVPEAPKAKPRHTEVYPDTDVKKPGDLFRTDAEILKNRAN